MTDQLPVRPYPKPTAQVAPYVEALGFEMAITFLLQFGGAELFITATPKGRSEFEALVGPERAAALGRIEHKLQRRVPLAKRWLAQCLTVRGLFANAVARTLRVTDVSVRSWLK